MLRLRRRRRATITFCDGCGEVCDARCRHEAGRRAALDRALALGVWR